MEPRRARIWDSFGLPNHEREGYYDVKVERLVYGPTPEDWSLEIYSLHTFYVHKLRPLP